MRGTIPILGTPAAPALDIVMITLKHTCTSNKHLGAGKQPSFSSLGPMRVISLFFKRSTSFVIGIHYIYRGDLPDLYHVVDTKGDAVHLGYKDGRHRLKKRCAVHVDSGANRE